MQEERLRYEDLKRKDQLNSPDPAFAAPLRVNTGMSMADSRLKLFPDITKRSELEG